MSSFESEFEVQVQSLSAPTPVPTIQDPISDAATVFQSILNLIQHMHKFHPCLVFVLFLSRSYDR